MAPTRQQLLDDVLVRIQEIVRGGVQDFSEGNERTKLLELGALQNLKTDLQADVNSQNGGLKPALPVNI